MTFEIKDKVNGGRTKGVKGNERWKDVRSWKLEEEEGEKKKVVEGKKEGS